MTSDPSQPGSLAEVMYDTTFVAEVLNYLEAAHGIRAQVVDGQGAPVAIGETKPALPAAGSSRHYPFAFAGGRIGGLSCTAESEEMLDRAAPHIAICLQGINQLLQREGELQQTSSEMLELSEQLYFLYSLANQVIGINNLQEFCSIILREIGQAIEADSALMKTSVHWRKQQEHIEIRSNISPERVAALEQLGSPFERASHGPIISSLPDETSILLAPIRGKEGAIGYLAFFRDAARHSFTAYQKKFVSIIENIYSPAIETIRLYDSLQEIYLNTVKALAAAIDAKDEHTHGHSFRVARYAVAIGRKMKIEGRSLNDLEIAAYMHDLGKIGISEAILGKPGKLSPEEYTEIKKHPVFTDKILQPINLPHFIVDAAVHHHERLDGSGYPKGLRGEQISPFARIIAVADVFDALTSNRPYRQAMPVETALKILCGEIDTKFDRQVVLAFVSSLKDEEIGSVLADGAINLNFASVHSLNDFLLELIDFLLPEHNSPQQSRPASSGPRAAISN